MKQLITWDLIYQDHGNATYRCAVLGGWLINHLHHETVALTFLPDANHQWIPEKKKDVIPLPTDEEKLLNKDIKALELTVRSYQALHFNGIKSIAHLVEHTASELSTFKNLGIKSLREIRQVLRSKGLNLKNDYFTADSKLNIAANFIHSNGDRERVTITGKDGHGNAWITWLRDDFKNMMPLSRLEIIGECRA